MNSILSLLVPRPTLRLVSDKANPVLAGRSLTLTCGVELDPVVNVPLNITAGWTGPDGSTLRPAAPAAMESTTHYTSTVVIRQVELANAGDYTCTISLETDIRMTAEKQVIVG